MYDILPDLRIVFFFVSPVIESFKKVFMRYFTKSYIIVYSTIIILDILDNMASGIRLKVVES